MRLGLVTTVAAAAVFGVSLPRGTQAAPVLGAAAQVSASVQAPVESVYYYRGAYYPYRYRGVYFRHRYYRSGRWHYY